MLRSLLTTKPHEGHEGFGYLIMNFVLFMSFVVKISFSVAARRNMFLVAETRQIGASICHGFGARNLKSEQGLPGH
jgi:hypothetical protein